MARNREDVTADEFDEHIQEPPPGFVSDPPDPADEFHEYDEQPYEAPAAEPDEDVPPEEEGGATAYASPALKAALTDATLEELATEWVQPSPFNARRYFDPDGIESLARSLQEHGQLQPIVVRRLITEANEYVYEIIAGERRWRAARHAQIPYVTAYVIEVDDSDARRLMLAENLQRTELSPWDELQSILGLLAAEMQAYPGWPMLLRRNENDERQAVARVLRSANRSPAGAPEGAAVTLGVPTEVLQELLDSVFAVGSGTTLSGFARRRLPLLRWPPEVLEALESGTVSFVAAEVVRAAEDPAVRRDLLERIEAGTLTNATDVREARDGRFPTEAHEASESVSTIRQRWSVANREMRRLDARLTANDRRSVEGALRKVEELIERVKARE